MNNKTELFDFAVSDGECRNNMYLVSYCNSSADLTFSSVNSIEELQEVLYKWIECNPFGLFHVLDISSGARWKFYQKDTTNFFMN